MNIPSALLDSLEGLPGFDRTSFVDVHAAAKQVSSIRFNPNKTLATPGSYALLPISGKVPWASNGYYLSSRPAYVFDPLWHAGTYYVQEASSMFLSEAIKQHADISSPLRVLDLCAAPGGKSTLLQGLLHPETMLICNEVIRNRVHLLEENLVKWGGINSFITSNDPADFGALPSFFDLIVIDAPCSGSGLFRRDPNAINEWSEESVQLCSKRQQRIMADAWPSLKDGGILIYCTCSYSRSEDEDIADWLGDNFSAIGMKIKVEDSWHITESESIRHHLPCYRFYPDKTAGEGFFLCCLQKTGGGISSINIKTIRQEKLSKQSSSIVRSFLKQSSVDLFKREDSIHIMHEGMAATVSFLMQHLKFRKTGTLAGHFAGNELIPAHDLAMDAVLSGKISTVSVDYDDAIRYLRKEDMSVVPNVQGWALIDYLGHPLGWIKSLQKRVNNYYPKNWRIRKLATSEPSATDDESQF